jgi:hypothetical protein
VPVPVVQPSLIVRLGALGREYPPRRIEVGARLVKGGRGAAQVFARLAARVEAADPLPRILVDRNAAAPRELADTDVAKVDVPAIGSVVVTAAGEDGHPGIKAQAEPVRKSSISLRRVARVHAARRSRAWG